MKARFSIFSLMALTAWTAVCFAALRSPMTGWSVAVPALWSAILAVFAVAAAQQTASKSVFARGVFLFTVLYSAAPWIRDGYFMKETEQWALPHMLIAEALLDMKTISPEAFVISPPGTIGFNFISGDEMDRRQNFRTLSLCNVSLAIGFLGGGLALWRYRRCERRSSQG